MSTLKNASMKVFFTFLLFAISINAFCQFPYAPGVSYIDTKFSDISFDNVEHHIIFTLELKPGQLYGRIVNVDGVDKPVLLYSSNIKIDIFAKDGIEILGGNADISDFNSVSVQKNTYARFVSNTYLQMKQASKNFPEKVPDGFTNYASFGTTVVNIGEGEANEPPYYFDFSGDEFIPIATYRVPYIGTITEDEDFMIVLRSEGNGYPRKDEGSFWSTNFGNIAEQGFRPAEFVPSGENLWKGQSGEGITNGHDWSVNENWTAGYPIGTGELLKFHDEAVDLIIDQEKNKTSGYDDYHTVSGVDISGTGRLIIRGGGLIEINPGSEALVVPTDNSKIIVEVGNKNTSNLGGSLNGSLIIPQGATVGATVDFTSKAYADPSEPDKETYDWQYFGIPFIDIPRSEFTQSEIRRYNENVTENGIYWYDVAATTTLDPFYGYEISVHNDRPNSTFTFSGDLITENKTINLLISSSSGYPSSPYYGQHVISNPYTAELPITEDMFPATGNTYKAVYVYNTGSLEQWRNANNKYEIIDGTGGSNTAGYYKVGLPKYTESLNENNFLKGIPAMQGFVVRSIPGSTGSYDFNFNYNNVRQHTEIMRSRREAEEHIYTRIDLVAGDLASDQLFIFTDDAATRGFDNGLDAHKYFTDQRLPFLYTIEEDNQRYHVDALADMDNTYIGFKATEGIENYKLVFYNQNIDQYYWNVYLLDLFNNQEKNVTASGSVYEFTADNTEKALKRFLIRTERKPDLPDGLIDIYYTQSNKVMVSNSYEKEAKVRIYTTTGMFLHEYTLAPFSHVCVSEGILTQGVYMVRAIVEDRENFSGKMIIK